MAKKRMGNIRNQYTRGCELLDVVWFKPLVLRGQGIGSAWEKYRVVVSEQQDVYQMLVVLESYSFGYFQCCCKKVRHKLLPLL